MKHKYSKSNLMGYLTLSIALVMFAVTGLAIANTDATAEETQTVTMTEAATVVASPFTEAVQEVKDSVVGVNNYIDISQQYNPYANYGFSYGSPQKEEQETDMLQASGSGVVVADGYVLTNYHVVEGANRLEITSGEDVYEAVLMGYDENKDIAVLKATDMHIEPVVIGDSDTLNVGDWAICIGNPLSFTGTTTVGIISGLGREVTNDTVDEYGRRVETVNTMIQTDAAINSGNSGGGMFNAAGELVGIPSMKISATYFSGASIEGISLAIPINDAKELIQSVISGEVDLSTGSTTTVASTDSKPRIGVTISNMNTSNYAVAYGYLPIGAYISAIEEGSPAELAGLQVSDIVVEIDGQRVEDTTTMLEILQAKEVGDTANVKVYRVEGLEEVESLEDLPDGEYVDVVVELAMLDGV